MTVEKMQKGQTAPLASVTGKISIQLIDDFPNHPYYVFDDDDMFELIKTGFDITSANSEYIAKIYEVAAKIACDKKLQGYKMVCNNGLSAGQMVFHLHIHMISEG